ncbi:MAG: site-specific integrase [Solirubrobacterales bacterium]
MAEAREAQGDRKAGDRCPTSKVLFGDYFAEWIEGYQGRTSRGFTETSRSLYRRAIVDHALPEWRTWKLAELEPADARALFKRLRDKGRSRATLKTLRAALSTMYATAAEEGIVRSNPIRGVRIPNSDGGQAREGSNPRGVAPPARGAARGRLLVEFLAVTGLRIGEAVGLTWEHLELGERPRVMVREQVYRGERKRLKSREGRRDVPLSRSMAARLLAHRRDTYSGPHGPVFATATGTPFDPHNVRRNVLNTVALELGYCETVRGSDGKPRKRTTLGFHAFRHTCASMLFAEGRNVKQVQEWLGHATPTITLETYVHLMDEGVGEALEIDAQGNTRATQCPAKAESAPTPVGAETTQ